MIAEKISSKSSDVNLALMQGNPVPVFNAILEQMDWPTYQRNVMTTNSGTPLLAISGYDCAAYTTDVFTSESYAGGIPGDGVIYGLYRGLNSAAAVAPPPFLGSAPNVADFRYFENMGSPGTDFSFTNFPVAGIAYKEQNVIMADNNNTFYGAYSSVSAGGETIGIYNWNLGVELAQHTLAADSVAAFDWGTYAVAVDVSEILWSGSATADPAFIKLDGTYFFVTLDDANLEGGTWTYFFGSCNDNRMYYGLTALDGDFYVISFEANADTYIAYRIGSGFDSLDLFYMLSATDIMTVATIGGLQYALTYANSPFPPTTGIGQYTVGSGPTAPIQKLGCTNFCLPLIGAK